MTEEPDASTEEAPGGRSRTLARESFGRWPGLVWALPVAAALIVGYLGLQAVAHRGVDVVVTFSSAADAKPGDTQVIFKGLTVGHVTKVGLSKDRRHVDMTLRLDPSVKPLLRQGTDFWLVGANPSLTDLSSLKAALAGVTIGMAPGDGPVARHFEGLDNPPQVFPGARGSQFTLLSNQVGATRPGASVYYHGLEVGKVTKVDLLGRNNFKTIIFVTEPYDHFVRKGTLFYNASAVQISLSGGGLSTQFAPGNAAFNGGVEFDTPSEIVDQAPPDPDAVYPLFADRGHALSGPRGPQVFYRILFTDPVGDLEIGAPVTLRGFQIGSVTARDLDFDASAGRLSTPVTVAIEPERLTGQIIPTPIRPSTVSSTDNMVQTLLTQGYRARLIQSPPLVGSRAVDLVQTDDQSKHGLIGGRAPGGGGYPVIPNAVSGDPAALVGKASDILSKVDKMPIVEIGDQVEQITAHLGALLGSPKMKDSLDHLDSTLKEVDALVGETKPKIGPLVDNLNRAADQIQGLAASANAVVSGDGSTQDASLPGTLRQLTDTARTIRSLADYLSRHPEALIRGKTPDR